MKRLFLVCMVLFGLISCGQKNDNVGTSRVVTNDKILSFSSEEDFATYLLSNYYRYIDRKEYFNITDFVTPEILPLMEIKVEVWHKRIDRFSLVYNDYGIEIIPSGFESVSYSNGIKYVTFLIKRVWREHAGGELSTSQYAVRLGIRKELENSYKLVSWISDGGLQFPLINEWYNEALKNGFSVNEVIERYRESCGRSLDALEEFLKPKKPTEDSADSKYTENVGLLSSLDRNAIKKWARDNFDRTYPSSAISGVSYYDFSVQMGMYDCTNFVSHALVAGGATMNDKGESGVTGEDVWYFRGNGNRSSSWAGVNQLYGFLTRWNAGNNSVGPYAELKSLEDAEIGDVVQFRYGDTWRHSGIITGVTGGITYTGRTSPSARNDDAEVKKAYADGYRLIHLLGDYTN